MSWIELRHFSEGDGEFRGTHVAFLHKLLRGRNHTKICMDRMTEHGRLGIARYFEPTERISGRRAKTVWMRIWALSCVINEDGLSYYFCYCDYYICYHLYAWYLQLYTWHHVSRVCTVAAVLYLQFVPLVLLFRMLDMFCTTSLVLSAVCVCGAQYGWGVFFFSFLDFVIPLYISQVFYELFWHGSSCPCYYWHHFLFSRSACAQSQL